MSMGFFYKIKKIRPSYLKKKNFFR